MKITVKLFATLRNFGENIQEIDVDDSIKVEDVIEKLKLPLEDVSIIMINGIGSKLESTLKDGDVLAIFPLVGGG
jgi:molybdopterin converting factor small subunit